MSSGAKDRFKRAEQAAKKGNYEYAVELYLQGLTLDPKAAEERRRLHQIEALSIEEQGGNPEGSMSSKMKTMGILAKVKKLTVQKKWDEALPEFEKALRFQPRNATLLLQAAQCCQNLGVEDEGYDAVAIVLLEDVIDYDKHNTDGLRRLGQLWAKQDDAERAIEYWEKLRMLKPDDKEASKAVRNLSAANMVKRAEDRKKQSGDETFKALLKDEDESAELEQKAKVIRTDDDRREAIEIKRTQLRQETTNSRLWRELGDLYRDLKDFKHAKAAYTRAKLVNPHDLFADDKIGALHEYVHDAQLEQLRAKVEAAKKNGSAEELTAMLRQKENDVLAFKIKEYDRRVKTHPTDYELKIRYGRLLMEGDRFDEAIEQFQKSIKDPKFKVSSQNNMGVCFR